MARPLKKQLLLWTRTLHIYATMLALVLLIFFSFSGFIMNHPGWFDTGHPRSIDRTITLPSALAADTGPDHKLKIVEYLRAQGGARGELKTYDDQEDPARIAFTGAGRKSDYTLGKSDGKTEIHEEIGNTLALMADLHKGTGSGDSWRRVIDISAIFLMFASLSGLILWISLAKRRMWGILALVTSIGGCGAVYWWLVP